MASPSFVQTVQFRDIKGQTATIRFYIPSASTLAQMQTFLNTLVPLTHAAPQRSRGIFQTDSEGVRYGAEGDFENVEDKAVFVFSTTSGDIVRTSLPAPKVGIFLDDEETINAAQTDVAAFIAQYITRVCNRDALLASTYIGGYRTRTARRKQTSIYTRNPQLTTQG